MENVSVSKGIFVHKGSYKIGKKGSKYNPNYLNEPWYIAYSETSRCIEQVAKNVTLKAFQQLVSNLESFVLKIKKGPQQSSCDSDSFIKFNHENAYCAIDTALLLTGVNAPDHATLFETLTDKLSNVTPYIALVQNRNANSVKSIIEDVVYQFIHRLASDDVPETRKSHCTLRALKKWLEEHHDSEEPLVIILQDFKNFSTNIVEDFISVLSSYGTKVKGMKFVLIIDTASVHLSLSSDVMSKLILQTFQAQTQIRMLTDMLENIVFFSNIPFRLTGPSLQLLIDVFLFYNMSVDNFLQNFKICMIQHFYDNNINFLCCQPKDIKKRISKLTAENIAEIKSLPSIAKYLKTSGKVTDGDKLSDTEFKELLEMLLNKFHNFMDKFLIILKCLHCMVASLPNAPMGTQLREIYTKAVDTSNLTESLKYKECLKLLRFTSKNDLLSKLESVLKILEDSQDPVIGKIKTDLNTHIDTIREASLEETGRVSSEFSLKSDKRLSRSELKKKLLGMSQQQPSSPYQKAQLNLIDYLDREMFSVHLVDPSRVAAHEIFCYSDVNQTKYHLRGSLRAALNTGLNNPQAYLNCDCCKLENEDDILHTLPDLCIIYKLHLESGKLINMYDWLQAFLTIVNRQAQATEQRDVDPRLQARFTQAVAALQFLGFIKTSRRKTDHVKRLT